MSDRKLGPNMIRLLAITASRVGNPEGTFAGSMEMFSSKERIIETTRKALVLVDEMIAVMKAATDNPYGDDEETIAGAILAELDKAKGRSSNATPIQD